MRVFLFLCLFSVLTIHSTAYCDSLHGEVMSVIDGVSIILHTDQKKQVKVRLYGIDSPTDDQAYGQKAKRFTFSLVYGKKVEVVSYGKDDHGRLIGIVLVDGMNANEEIIRSGYGWQYRKLCKASFCSEWLQLENDAKISGVGLWRDENPVPPWEWRKGKQDKATLASSGSI